MWLLLFLLTTTGTIQEEKVSVRDRKSDVSFGQVKSEMFIRYPSKYMILGSPRYGFNVKILCMR